MISHRSLLRRSLIAALALLSVSSAVAVGEPLEVGDFLKKAEALEGQTVQVAGFVTEVCLHRGCKLYLRDQRVDHSSTIRVERTLNTPPFDGEMTGDTVAIEGVVRTLRIDAAYLDQWEARVGGKVPAGVPEELGGCNIDDEASAKGPEADRVRQETLARIASFRERIARNSRGYLLSVWLDCEKIHSRE